MSETLDVNQVFRKGLVFGLDVGVASIGYAVRRGEEFVDVGLRLFPKEVGNLKNRRNLRRGRRTLKARKIRLMRMRDILNEIGLPPPPEPNTIPDPVCLRLKAVRGEELRPEDMHAALRHLFRKRGYMKAPWARAPEENEEETKKREKEEAEAEKKASELEKDMKSHNFSYPCELLHFKRYGFTPPQGGCNKHAPPSGFQPKPTKGLVWKREQIVGEFEKICEAQKGRFPKLWENRDKILYGAIPKDGKQPVSLVHSRRGLWEEGGVLTLVEARFDNRGPNLDRFTPHDEAGRPIHVARANDARVRKATFRSALDNLRLWDAQERRKTEPSPEIRQKLQEYFDKNGSLSVERLRSILKEAGNRYQVGEDQTDLTPKPKGRATISRPTAEKILSGELPPRPPQPIIRYPAESPERAYSRLLGEIVHPLVRDRIQKLWALLAELERRHGKPDLVIVEYARDWIEETMAKKKRRAWIKRQKENQEARKKAREWLQEAGYSSTPRNIEKYLLCQETKWRCAYCGKGSQADFNKFEVEHILPRSCEFATNERINLTVAHPACNARKGDRLPLQAGFDPTVLQGIAEGFPKDKQTLFLASDVKTAEKLLERRADFTATAYIAKVLRRFVLLRYGWHTPEGHDPTCQPRQTQRFQVVPSGLLSQVRRAWGLTDVLWSAEDRRRRRELDQKEEKGNLDEKEREELERLHGKNRADHRHHAVDAMVAASILPWAAMAPAGKGGWRRWVGKGVGGYYTWGNPVGCNRRRVEEWLKKIQENPGRYCQYLPRSGWKAQHYDLTLLGERQNQLIAREPLEEVLDGAPKRFEDVYPPELGYYLRCAWKEVYQPTYDRQLPEARKKSEAGEIKTKPEVEAHRLALEALKGALCFSCFQRWREEKLKPAYEKYKQGLIAKPAKRRGRRPKPLSKEEMEQREQEKWRKWLFKVCSVAINLHSPEEGHWRIPIENVRRVRLESKDAALPLSRDKDSEGRPKGNGPFVERRGFREVRVYKNREGEYEKVRLPHSRFDPLWKVAAIRRREKPEAVFRVGGTVQAVKDFKYGGYKGKANELFVLKAIGDQVLFVVPFFCADPKAWGLGESGIGIRWTPFLKHFQPCPTTSSTS